MRDSLMYYNSFVGARMSGVHVEDVKFDHSRFEGADLTAVRLIDTGLEWCNLTGAVLNGFLDVRLTDADLHFARVIGAQLAGTPMQRVNARATDFRKSNLQGADLTYSHLENANFMGATVSGADFTGSLFDGADFTAAIGTSAATFRSVHGVAVGLRQQPYANIQRQ